RLKRRWRLPAARGTVNEWANGVTGAPADWSAGLQPAAAVNESANDVTGAPGRPGRLNPKLHLHLNPNLNPNQNPKIFSILCTLSLEMCYVTLRWVAPSKWRPALALT